MKKKLTAFVLTILMAATMMPFAASADSGEQPGQSDPSNPPSTEQPTEGVTEAPSTEAPTEATTTVTVQDSKNTDSKSVKTADTVPVDIMIILLIISAGALGSIYLGGHKN